MKYMCLLLLISLSVYSQEQEGNLLLLKIHKERDLAIEKHVVLFHAIKLDSAYIPKTNDFSKQLFSSGYTDLHIECCKTNDSIRLKTFQSNNAFNYDSKEGLKNLAKIDEVEKNMKLLIEMKVKSSLYNQKIKVYYVVIKGKYCEGILAKKDQRMLGLLKPEVLLLTDEIEVLNDIEIQKPYLYDILTRIDFSGFMYN